MQQIIAVLVGYCQYTTQGLFKGKIFNIQGLVHSIAAASIITEVTAQEDVILYSSKSELFVQIKLSKKDVACA